MNRRLVLACIALLVHAAGCEADEPEHDDASPGASPSSAPGTTTAAGDDAPGEPARANAELEPPPIVAAPDAPAGLAEPPENFGAIRPPRPPPSDAERTVHALAGYEVVSVYSLPDLASPRLGYLRIGARAMVTPRIDDQGKGCDKGFHALAAGGYACASKGLIVDAAKPPYMYMPPPPPRIDAPIPYDYGVVVADGTPMWWRIPDAEEVMLAAQKYRAIVAAEEAKAAAAAPASKPAAKPAAGAEAPAPATADAPAPADAPAAPAAPAPSDAPAAPAPDAPAPATTPDASGSAAPPAEPPRELTPEEKAELRRREAERKKREAERKKREAEKERLLARKRARLPLNSQTPFMEAGFVVTLADKLREAGQAWWKTTRGGYVQAGRIARKGTSDFHGGEIPADARAAFGFVIAERGASAMLRGADGKLKYKRRLEFRELVTAAEEVAIGGRSYLVTADGLHVRKDDLRMAVPATRPDDVQPWERWIDVDLERQLLVAYDGDVPVYATLISSGRRDTAEDSFSTPKGNFRITAKHVSSSMDGNTASDGRYSIQDVPWAMFFSGNYALHGAFWHQKFGERRSHGCINLGPTDARWLFFWTTPLIPEGWHGVNAHEGAPGSMVVIH